MMMVFAIVTTLTSPTFAAEPRLLETHGDWTAYVLIEDGSKVCYMASRPQKEEGNYTQRGEIVALVMHRPAEGTNNVFSYIAGYPYKDGSDAAVAIGNKHFTLFTQNERAWARDDETDNRLVQAIRAGSEMTVKGTSSRGTATTDTFSLTGSAAAYAAISKACKVK